MLAFNSDPELKAFILQELNAHAQSDRLTKGVYWEGGKGCAIGCTLEAVLQWRKMKITEFQSIIHSRHADYEIFLGIPEGIAYLEDRIFENLTHKSAMEWPMKFTKAITPGADLTLVWPKFAVWMLEELLTPVEKTTRIRELLEKVTKLLQEWIDGTKPERERWENLERHAQDIYEEFPRNENNCGDFVYESEMLHVAIKVTSDNAYETHTACFFAAKAYGTSAWDIMADKLLKLLSAEWTQTVQSE